MIVVRRQWESLAHSANPDTSRGDIFKKRGTFPSCHSSNRTVTRTSAQVQISNSNTNNRMNTSTNLCTRTENRYFDESFRSLPRKDSPFWQETSGYYDKLFTLSRKKSRSVVCCPWSVVYNSLIRISASKKNHKNRVKLRTTDNRLRTPPFGE